MKIIWAHFCLKTHVIINHINSDQIPGFNSNRMKGNNLVKARREQVDDCSESFPINTDNLSL